MDIQAERTIQTLDDMIRFCVTYFGGSWVNHFPLKDFACNNSYYARIYMAPFEVLYGRRVRPPIGWYKVGESRFVWSRLVFTMM